MTRSSPSSRIYELARLELARLTPSPETPLQAIFQRATELIAEALQVERVGIWLLVDDRSALRCLNLYERSKQEHSEGATLRVEDFPNYFQALEQRKAIPAVVAACDPITAELYEAYLKPLNITSMLDAPIFVGGQVVGVVCHEHTEFPREWSTEDRDFAASCADLMALKIKSAELEQAQSALRMLSGQLAESKRLDTLGQLAAGISHDFKNLLTVILGSADMLARKGPLTDSQRTLVQHIIEAAERGSEMTAELMQCARNSTRATKVVKVDELVQQLLPLLRRAIGKNHELHYTTTSAQGRVLIEGASLERVLMNLVVNARDAMPDGGSIRLALDGHAKPAGHDSAQVYVSLEVTDDGIGITPAVLDRIFEPFFTTKGDGQGTGLGLAVVKQVVERAGGFIKVASEPGRGTTFTIYLPRITGD